MEAAVHGAHASWTHAHTRARQPPALQGARLPRTREQRPGSPPKATPASLPQGSSGFQPPPRSGPALGPGHSLRGLDTGTCADGSPAPGPGSLVTQGGARPAPPATYLPRSRQSRRACASGSRPYSPRAAAATCPAARVRRGAGRAEGRRARGAGRGSSPGCSRARSLWGPSTAQGRGPRPPRPLLAVSRRLGSPPLPLLPGAPRVALLRPPRPPEKLGLPPRAGTTERAPRQLQRAGDTRRRRRSRNGRRQRARAARRGRGGRAQSRGAAWRRSAGNATGELNPGGCPEEGHCERDQPGGGLEKERGKCHRRAQSRGAAWRSGHGPKPPRCTHRS